MKQVCWHSRRSKAYRGLPEARMAGATVEETAFEDVNMWHLNCVALACRCNLSLFSDVGPLETIVENKKEQKSAAKRRQRLLKAPLKPPSYDARFPTARSV